MPGEERGSLVMRPNSSVEDRRFYQRLVARELDALGEVYDRYVAVVYGVAMTVTADRGAADGVTQEVFLDLWRQPERFDPSRGPLRPWLAMLAHRRAVETVRDRNIGPAGDQRSAMSVDRVVDIDEIAQSVLNTEEVRTALGALPEDERAAIRLAYFAGKTYCQVAAELDVAAEVIKARIDSGLRRLARSLHVEVVGRQEA
jgi:RNA polymerase sigma factor (sigma-70 family)